MKGINKKILSLLLAFSMLLSLLPAAAFSEPDAEITAFRPILIDGGTAGLAGYAEATAAIEYLNTSHASVTASTYGGEVSVPVTAWTDTDGYNPAVAGSYTFTATLGDIPAGYANPNSLTAVAEVAVAENAGMAEDVGPGEVDGTALLPPNAMAALEMEGGAIEDGEYTIPVRLWHAVSDQASMGDAALEQTARLVVEEGQGALQLTFKPLTFIGLTGYLSQLDLLDNIVFNENNYPADYDLIPATVLTTYDVVDDFNKPDSADPNCAGKPYPKDLSVPVALEQEYTWVHVYVPVMGSLSSGDQVARIKLDWSGLEEVGEPEPEPIVITGFDAVTLDAGEAGSATYADAAAVIAALPAAATIFGAGDTVPVTGWTDTDTYDPDTAGSYTFTAALGDLPAGYANPNDLTATAEVVVAAGSGAAIADGEYTLPVRLWHAADNQPSMGNNALEQTAHLVVADGQGTLHLTFKSLTFMGMEGYLSQLDLLDNIVFNQNNYPTAYDLIPAAVISTYDVVDQFNGPDSSDPNCRNKPYPKDLSVPVVLEQEYTWVHVYVPVMGSLGGFGDQVARIKLDWNGLIAVGEPDPDADPVLEIGDGDGDGAIELTGNDLTGVTDPTRNVGLSAGGANMNIPAGYLNNMFAGSSGATIKFEAKESPADTKADVFQLLGDDDELAGSFDLNLTLGDTAITELGGRVKITLTLTDAQVTVLQNADSRKLCHYNPVTGALTDMNAVFDLTAKTVFFYTDHLSTYALVSTTTPGPGSGGNTGGDGNTDGNSHGLANGTYRIEVDALKEYTNERSMADQFFIEAAELEVSGETITVTVVMYGTASSPQMPTGIKMSYINSLQYRDSSGSWVDAIDSRNEAEDSLTVKMTVSSLNDVYMRVQTDYMGSGYQVFRLVFDERSIGEGGVSFGSEVTRDEYTITATAGEGGSISPSGDVRVNKGDDQTFTITADTGYKIKDVLVNDKSVGPVSKYTFTNVEANGKINVAFEKIEVVLVPIEKAAGIPMELKFTDIAGHWAEKVIHFVVQRGLFAGTSETLFSPDAFITRGMFVTVLGRISQIDPARYSTPRFADVDPDLYYAPYINWAASYDIVKGVGDGRFEPDREITREEMAVLFVKYANFAGIDLSAASAAPTTAATPTTPATPTAPTTPETDALTTVAPEGGLQDGRYTIDASALMENKDDLSMADQFLTEPAALTVAGGRITAAMVWHGTEYVTMDMLEELKIQRSGGELVDVEKVVNLEENTLTITFEVEDLKKATVMQVYVPRGMGEMRPKFRLVFDSASLREQVSAGADIDEQGAAPESSLQEPVSAFADAGEISDWAKDSVEKMRTAGFIKGKGNNRFDPRGFTTRAEAAVILAKSVGYTP